MNRALSCMLLLAGSVLAPAVAPVATAAAAAEVSIRNERELFPLTSAAGQVRAELPAVLSPAGDALLYARARPGGDVNDADAPGELVLRHLATGRETILDTGPVSIGNAAGLLLHQPFDPRGKLLAFPDYRKDPANRLGDMSRPVRVLEVATGRTADTNITADLRYARIDATGQFLVGGEDRAVRALRGNRSQKLDAPGHLDSVSPTAPIASFFLTDAEPGGPKIVLWNFDTNRLALALPTDPKNRSLDDVFPQWTSDGSCIYYSGAADADGNTASRWVDLKARRDGRVDHATPVGPGPSPQTMLLRRMTGQDVALFVHRRATGSLERVAVGSDRILAARGRYVVYAKGEEGSERVYLAELATQDAPVPPPDTPRRPAAPGVGATTTPAPPGADARDPLRVPRGPQPRRP